MSINSEVISTSAVHRCPDADREQGLISPRPEVLLGIAMHGSPRHPSPEVIWLCGTEAGPRFRNSHDWQHQPHPPKSTGLCPYQGFSSTPQNLTYIIPPRIICRKWRVLFSLSIWARITSGINTSDIGP